VTLEDQMAVGEVAALSPGAVKVLDSHGIDYCCGGRRTLEDVCAEKGLSARQLMEEIDAGDAVAGSPEDDWKTVPLRRLIGHIVSTHHEFLKLELPRIGQRLAKVVEVHGAKDPALGELQPVYDGMRRELELHMHKEELMLFPAIGRYEAAAESGKPLPPALFGSVANSIAAMEKEHDSAGVELRRIRDLTRDFEPPEYACTTYRSLLDGLRALESDLRTHVHLENNILFPRAIALEKSYPK